VSTCRFLAASARTDQIWKARWNRSTTRYPRRERAAESIGTAAGGDTRLAVSRLAVRRPSAAAGIDWLCGTGGGDDRQGVARASEPGTC